MRHLKNEKGIALVMVLVLSAIALAIMAALVYMIMSGTETSGIQKRYRSAVEAGIGGSEITYQIIGLRGEAASLTTFRAALTGLGIANSIQTLGACSGTSGGATYTGLTAKLMTENWVIDADCNSSITINPVDTATYDMSYDLGTGTTYRIYAKIVNTVQGNTGGDEGLWKSGVVAANIGEVSAQARPYLYTIEMLVQNPANPDERSKLSILYQY